jgi:hypothetical protein
MIMSQIKKPVSLEPEWLMDLEIETNRFFA